MSRSFRWRLALSYLAVILFFILVAGLTSARSVDAFYVKHLRGQLVSSANLTAELVKGMDFNSPTEKMEDTAIRAARDINARITVIASDGTVLADSRKFDVAAMENHLQRPEISAALKGNPETSIRYSETLKTKMLYAAVPCFQGDKVIGAVRLALPLEQVEGLLRRLWSVIFVSMGLAGLVALLLGMQFLGRVIRPVSELTRVARSIAAGNLQARAGYNQDDEIGVLARTMNNMAANLEENIGELSETKNHLETVLLNTVNGIILLDQAYQILFINPAACELLGVECEKALGKRQIHVTRSYDFTRSLEEVMKEKRPVKRELILHNLGGKTVQTAIVPIVEDQKCHGVLVVFNDITELKHLENIRRDFVANVSHELKTPVAAISGFAETLMMENPDNSSVYEFSNIILEESLRLSRLVDSLMELSRIESESPDLNLEKFDLRECVRDTLARMEPRIAEKNLRISLCLPEQELVVKADWDRITQVLINLLENAVNFSDSGEVLEIGAKRQDEAATVVWVKDNGPGIPEEEAGRVFERFYRVDKARARKDGGTGLGLSIVKHIVEAHGGQVSVYSRAGQGAVFYFTLPAVNPEK